MMFAPFVFAVASQAGSSGRPIVKLWPKGAPGGWTRTDKEVSEAQKDDFVIVKNVSEPTLEFFRAKGAKPDAPTVVILPGGGYWVEAIEHEGWEIAERLNLAGIHAAVLKYRLPNREQDKPLHKVVVEDAHRALRIVRSRAAEFGMGAGRVGVLGFSAGGHAAAVTSTAATPTYANLDAADTIAFRPDFSVLIYPAYLNREGSMDLSDGLAVDAKWPKTFIAQTADDWTLVNGSYALAHALNGVKVPVEMHIFPSGGHGYGLRTHAAGIGTWPDLLIDWIRRD